MSEIGDWAYAREAAYLQMRIDAWREHGDHSGEDAPEWESLEALLREWIRCNTLPKGETSRPAFDRQAALGLGYAISIIIKRWDSRADYNFPRRRVSS